MLELPAPSHGMPAGVYYFADRTIWRSTDSGRYWKPYSTLLPPQLRRLAGTFSAQGLCGRTTGTAHNKEDMSQPIHNWPISGFPGDSVAFYFQSEVYRRNDGTFLHGARTPGRRRRRRLG